MSKLLFTLKHNLRWIIPLLLVAIVAAYFILGPVLGAHAANLADPNVTINPH